MGKKSKSTKADPTNHRKFIAKVALFNSVGFCFLTAGITYFDARLKTRITYGARTYRWGYWVCAVGSLAVLLTTLISLSKTSSARLRTILPTAILLVAGAASLPFFRPEFPHGAMTSWTFYLSMVSLLSCGTHYWQIPEDWLSWDLSEEVKVERVKQYANQWRTVAVTTTVAYLAMVIPWTSFVWTDFPSIFVTDASEKIVLSQFTSAGLIGLSLYVISGVVYEAFNKANEAAELLLRVRSTNS